MDLELTDKVAVVTGASKGIGLAVTKALVAEGAYVIAGTRTTDGLEGLERVTAVASDLTAPVAPAQLVQRAVSEHGRLDVLVNVTKALSQEFGPKGIRVNTVSPGPVSTDLWLGNRGVAETVAHASGVDKDTARKSIVAGMGGIPTGRFSTPDEVATLVVFLASERTANVTGANYVIDGGLIKTT